MKKINVIGYSGSGKTYLIKKFIQGLKNELNLNSAVIKNIHEHQIDSEGKDSFIYTKKGANYAITKNIYDETTIFIKKKVNIEDLLEWINKGPFKVDIVFTEGFRELNIPSILCLKTIEKYKDQINENVRVISGKISIVTEKKEIDNLPVLNIEQSFNRFIEIFNIV
ncbi:MAG: molybdopterin-guanine dinucleotide biosynthesis protein B [Promethearchaeati archaeon]